MQDEAGILRAKDQEAASCQNSDVQKLEEEMKKLQKNVVGRDTVISQLREEMKALHLAHESSVIIPVQATTKPRAI